MASDPDFASVEFLAGFNGADAATAFTEESNNAAVATFGNQAQLDTAQKKFGTASAMFDNSTTDYITFPDIAAYDLGNGDFTIEYWIRFRSIPTSGVQQEWLGQWDNDGLGGKSWLLGLWNNSGTYKLRWLHSFNGTTTLVDDITWTTPAIDTWYHIAHCRNGADMRYFIDGTQLGSTFDMSTSTLHAAAEPLLLGGIKSGALPPLSALDFDGWLDEVRITVGVARYTANFTAPTEAFPRTDATDEPIIIFSGF